MGDAPWKVLERQVGAALGGRRALQKGRAVSDVEGTPFVVECKQRATFAVDTLFRGERAKRRKELRDGKPFLLVIRAKGREPLAVLSLKDFAALVGEGGECMGTGGRFRG